MEQGLTTPGLFPVLLASTPLSSGDSLSQARRSLGGTDLALPWGWQVTWAGLHIQTCYQAREKELITPMSASVTLKLS